MVARVGGPGLALFCLGAAGPAVPGASLPVQCNAIGTKVFVPVVTPQYACARFIRALGAGSGTAASLTAVAPHEGLIVELRFGPHGVASARAMRVRAGRKIPLPVYELAISDRQLAPSDIDILAGDVARGLTGSMTRKGSG